MMRLLILPLLLAASPAFAAPFQDTAAIDRGVAAFTGAAIGAEGGAQSRVDDRLKLAACPMVSMAWRSDRHDTVVVTCTGPDWRLFVPVLAPTPAPAAPRAMAAVAVAPPKPVIVIKRGDPVMISAGLPGFQIMREGIAMGDAAQGNRFLVKVDDSRNGVQAIAVEQGRATLPGWTE
ncbi:flagella basal body P-ring formation protein FlgA [Sphingomonas immobilis]|uniref:Flagella basal body P-ring formation protein FlgA n=1 Tax=Sphingomonas immobilis TaxID=3063997 RepID=A0ABT8ZV92_9SPHN|nr:flagella basal body P-ring formation protein FlgA [Sphingomonas sp. CA1-15]MDO7841499.1 flagella basal body P-ring formation protein FlgA [Sphingomonas sp. CA1-15]